MTSAIHYFNEEKGILANELLGLRQNLLHNSDSSRVRQALSQFIASGILTTSTLENNDVAINILKYFSRLHGFPPEFQFVIYESLQNKSNANASFKFKVALALKYAVQHNHAFLGLRPTLQLLFKGFPLDLIATSNNLDYFSQETIAQLLLTIITILNPDRVSLENCPESDLWKLENYLAHINGKYKSEVRRCLEKMGYWSGSVSHRKGGRFGAKGDAFIRDGQAILGEMQIKRGFSVSAHVVKTQQTEALTTEENVSEKTQMANISLNNALEHGRARTMQAQREREALPPTKSASGSERRWYRNTAFEIDYFHQKALGDDAISHDDIAYLSDKFKGGRWSILESNSSMICKIAKIFFKIAKYQKLDTELIMHLLKYVLNDKFEVDQARVDILQATGLYCDRLGMVPDDIRSNLHEFINSPEGTESSYDVKSVIMEILMSGDDRSGENMKVFLRMLKEEQHCMSALNYIQRQTTEARSQAVKECNLSDDLLQVVVDSRSRILKCKRESSKYEDNNEQGESSMNPSNDFLHIAAHNPLLGLVWNPIGTIVHAGKIREVRRKEEQESAIWMSLHINKQLIPKAMEVLEDYLDLSWAPGLTPNQFETLIEQVSSEEEASENILRATAKLILKSMEKGLKEPIYFDQFLDTQLNSHFDFLFNLTASSNVDQTLRIITMVMLSNIFEGERVRRYMNRMTSEHVNSFLKEICGGNGILLENMKLISAEELQDYNEDQYAYVSAYLAKMILYLVHEKPDLVQEESVVSTLSQVMLDTGDTMTKIYCSEIFFELVTRRKGNANDGYMFSCPVLNRIQSLTLSQISDVRIYTTSAYCISLAHQSKQMLPLEADHVDFLVNLYQYKKVLLNRKDYTVWINPNILFVFWEACRQQLQVSEHVFHLLAHILNNTCADSENSQEFHTVKIILDMVTMHCRSKRAGEMPATIVEAVEHLLLESDVFDEICAGIVEQCMLAGKWISDAVVEEFSKYLWREPSISMPFLRRLAIANENQDLPPAIFDNFQMELIATRLSALKHPAFAKDVQLMGFRLGDRETREELFRSLTMYVSKGMYMTDLSLNAITSLLIDWKGKGEKIEAVLKCLTICSSNGQTLPKEIIALGLDLNNGATYVAQLEFAIEIVRRSQQIAPLFYNDFYRRFGRISGNIETPESRKIIELTKTMIQHNHYLPPEMVSQYCQCLSKNKENLSIDMISSLIRLVEGGIVSMKTKESLLECKEIFKVATDSENVALFEIGSAGLGAIPLECYDRDELKTLKLRGLLKSKGSSAPTNENNLWQLVQLSLTDPLWKEKWHPELMSELALEICTDLEFIRNIGHLLNGGTGPLNEFEKLLLEMLCVSCASANEKRNSYNDRILEACQTILEHLISGRRNHNLSSSCAAYLGRLDWARKFMNGDHPVFAALSQFKRNASEQAINDLLKILNDPKVCDEYSIEILKCLEVFKSNQTGFSILNSIASFTSLFSSAKQPDPLSESTCTPENVELLILKGEGRIPPIVLHAYALALQAVKTTLHLPECIQSLADYFNENHSDLHWNEIALIFKIFKHSALHSNKLPHANTETILKNFVHSNDALVRGECFSVMKILRERNLLGDLEPLWDKTFQTLTVFSGETGKSFIKETPAFVQLVHTLLTLNTLDRKSLQKMKESEWSHHLMASDMTLTLATSIQEEVELYPEALEFCRGIGDPQERMYVINSMKDFIKENHQISPGRILHCLNILRKVVSKTIGPPWSNACTLLRKQIFYGLALKLNDKLQGEEEMNLNVAIVTMEQATMEPNPVSLQLLERVIHVIYKSTATLHHFKELLSFIKENHGSNEALRLYLKGIQDPIPMTDFVASAKAVILIAQLPTCQDSILRTLNDHTKHLICNHFSFSHLLQIFQNLGNAIKSKFVTFESGSQILENVFYQMIAYRVSSKRFPYICEILFKKQVTEWISACNEIIMEHLYAGSQGVKSSKTVAQEFIQINGIEDFLFSDFETLVEDIQEGILTTSLSGLSAKYICDWDKSDIKTWSSRIKDGSVEWSPEFMKEALAVISRGCLILKSYRLTSIQILSICNCITLEGDNKGRLLQVATGSGKSTIIVALAVIQRLMGTQVDIYTSSPVLAERDAKAWAPFYSLFGLTCDHNGDKGSGYVRGEKTCYKKDIVYGDTAQFQFDTLRHEYSGLGTRAQRKYEYALIDEVDAMFVDDSSKLARLSSTIPGMDLLQILYHLIWQRLHDIQGRMYAVGNSVYYLEGLRSLDDQGIMHYTHLAPDGKERHIPNLAIFILHSQNDLSALEKAFIFKVEKIDDFVVKHLQDYIRALIGDHQFKENGKNIQKLPLPKPLQNFARSQVNNWVDSALTAVAFSENVHYVVDQEQIKPVDYHSTGIIQASTNWNNGLHQFLQIKHSLKVSTETVTTNFLSNMAMFQKYDRNLVGFTGTLGSPFSQSFLQDVYSVETKIIPELYYKRFEELTPKVVASQSDWLRKITQSAIHESNKRRAVLVICQTIKEADLIADAVGKIHEGNKVDVRLYTRNDQNQERRVEQVIEGDIIVATNLAGRGTDINTVKVEKHGGLHVILTFLPDTLRVEEQAFGRTSRQGLKGTGELILLSPVDGVTCNELKHSRDKMEETRLSSFKEKELIIIQTKDKLFSKFCKIFSNIRKELSTSVVKILGYDGLTPLEQTRLHAIEQEWAIFLKKIDDCEIKTSDAEKMYSSFQNKVNKTYEDVEKSISVTGNCFYWIQFGNEYYRLGNTWKDNTSIAYRYFQKAIEMDEDFSSGAHAGLGFCLLRGKNHWIGQNSHKSGYQRNAIDHLKNALKIVYGEISMYSTAQTLLKQRGGRMDSDLFKQLTEKINLLGEYCNNIQGIITTVEKSLRAVYVTQIISSDPESSATCKLNDDNPSIANCNRNWRYELEFHDLTSSYDMGTKDQAVYTLKHGENIEVQVLNQNLRALMDCVEKTTKSIQHLELEGVGSIQGVKQIVDAVKCKGYIVKVSNTSAQFMAKVMESVKARKMLVEWSDGESTYRKQVNSSQDLKLISSDKKLTLEVYFGGVSRSLASLLQFNTTNDLNDETGLAILESLLRPEPDISLVLVEVSQSEIRKNWTEPRKSKEEEKVEPPGILQSFSNNISSFKNLSKKDATEMITSLRAKHIPFVIRLESMKYDKADYALSKSGREVEDIKEHGLKEMGFQFSSTYVPIEILQDLQQRGLVLMPEFMENAFIPWRSVVTMGIIASVQVAAGGVLICTGFGATVGMGLVTEGMSDYVNAHRAYSSRNFSWTDYAIQKSVSLTISCVSMGLSSLKDGAKGAQTLVQGMATEAVEQAGTKVITDKSLNQGIKVAGANLKSLAGKYIAVQGCETVARTGLNMAVNSVLEFSFDSVKSHISHEVEMNVKIQFRHPRFVDALSTCVAMDKGGQLGSKLDCWTSDVTNPKSGNWNKSWDSVGLPLCQGILSDPKYLGSKFSMAMRVSGMINGCREIATVVGNVCDHVLRKLQTEGKTFTPAYLIQDRFGLKKNEALDIVGLTTFGSKSQFHVTKYPDQHSLRKYNVELKDMMDLFDGKHENKIKFSKDGEIMSRCIAKVVSQLTNHIIGVANRQLAQPMTTFAVGKLVNKISQEIQSKYLVREEQMSDDQKRAKELRKKDPDTLSPEEKAFLMKHESPVTFVDQIRGNAKDYTIAYQKRDIIAVLQTMTEEQKLNKKPPENLTKEQFATVRQILKGDPADMTVVFMLAQLNNADVKIVTDPNYTPTDDDKLNGTKIIIWEAGESGNDMGHYKLKDASTGEIKDFPNRKGEGYEHDCLYNVFSEITGLSPDQLREQAAVFVACNGDVFAKINESSEWIKERYPEQAAELLHLGGRAPQYYDTDIQAVNELRVGRDGVVLDHIISLRKGKGLGSTPEDGKIRDNVTKLNELIRLNKHRQFNYEINGVVQETSIAAAYLRGLVSGHHAKAKWGVRGTDKNMSVLANTTNLRMDGQYEQRIEKFRKWIDKEERRRGIELVKQEYCKVGFRANEGHLVLDDKDNTRIPFSEEISCYAYLDPKNVTDDPVFREEVFAQFQHFCTREVGEDLHKMTRIPDFQPTRSNEVYQYAFGINFINFNVTTVISDGKLLPVSSDVEDIESSQQEEM